MNNFRENGAIGALLDEYERALNELADSLNRISDTQLKEIVDPTNEDCASIQTILSHVIKAGDWYLIEIKRALGESVDQPVKIQFQTVEAYTNHFPILIKNLEKLFNKYPDIDLYSPRNFRWKHISNIDLLLEHAIVHILRHRRQIERYFLTITTRT